MNARDSSLIRAVRGLSGSRRAQLASGLLEVAGQMKLGAGAAGMFFEERGRAAARVRRSANARR